MKMFVDFGGGENRFAVFGSGGDEVERVVGEKPVETFDSGRTLIRIHAHNCSRGLRPPKEI